ncbi:hypothetical protein S7335_4307 [Synechococcus sp. PCC 7335]|nr:hypothetical protein S7335_4307 [Synechococcus sp. PCC 7335]
MLLSHNFTLIESEVHPLNREQFADVFVKRLSEKPGVKCTLIENPHWVVEVNYSADTYSPSEVGQLCVDALANYRTASADIKSFTIMALGGVKNTPATTPAPSLQTGEWGVDIVETTDPGVFLEEINWETLSQAKPAEDVFRIECEVE